MAGATETGICMLEYSKERVAKHFGEPDEYISERTPLLDQLEGELHEYFDGSRRKFEVPLDLIGTDFQKSVWKALLEIPYGKTSTYLDQSRVLGDVKAIRAVAAANGQNKISIVVPCHRVIGSDGSLTGYAGGLSAKQYLLNLESTQLSLFQ